MINDVSLKEEYVDPITAAQILNVSRSRVNKLCHEGRFQGAIKTGWSWIIPKLAVKNFERRKRGPKSSNDILTSAFKNANNFNGACAS